MAIDVWKVGLVVAVAVPVGLVAWFISRAPAATSQVDVAPPVASALAAPRPDAPDDHEDDRSYVFRIPSGEPMSLTCDEARIVVDQVRAGLAYPPEGVKPAAFAASAADWLDPHGLLTLASDAPTAAALAKAAPDLLSDIEGRRQRSCASALVPGGVLEAWTSQLREAFDRGRKDPRKVLAGAAALDPIPASGTGMVSDRPVTKVAPLMPRCLSAPRA